MGLVAAGLSGLVADIAIIIITLRLNFKVELPSVDLVITEGAATGFMDTRPFTALPVGNFTSSANPGNGMVRVRNLQIEGGANLFINLIGNKVQIRVLEVAVFSFGDLCLDMGPNFTIGGSPVDWVDFCANFKSRFEVEYANMQLRNALIEKVRVAGNILVGEYTLDELIDLIGGGDGEPCVAK